MRSAYQESLDHQGHVRDAAQEFVVDCLADLQADLVHFISPLQRIRRALRLPGTRDCVPGLYLWGDVGRGKTFLMDLFFETLAVEKKTRIHFHRMMADVHRRLKGLANVSDPLDSVAADIADQTRVLCFDEFYVSDIADAIIFGPLARRPVSARSDACRDIELATVGALCEWPAERTILAGNRTVGNPYSGAACRW